MKERNASAFEKRSPGDEKRDAGPNAAAFFRHFNRQAGKEKSTSER
jgi:hypothetical protein